MTADVVIAELSAMGVVVVSPSPGKIRLTAESGRVPDEAVALARDHKPALIAAIGSSCRPHNNADNYIDAPVENRPGWIRTTCCVCGRFIGYRRYEGR
ncbi:hypothetical protein [Rhodopirellula baltica]